MLCTLVHVPCGNKKKYGWQLNDDKKLILNGIIEAKLKHLSVIGIKLR